MSDDDISPKGCLVLAAFIDEVGQRSFGDAWTGQEANARLLPGPQTDADVLAIIDKLRGNQHHLPLPDDAPPVRDPPRSIANSDWGKPEAPRRAASSLQWTEALAEIDRVNAEPRAALARLADVERHCAEQLIWGEAEAVVGHALEPIAATWWGDDWKAKLRHGKKDGKPIFVCQHAAREEHPPPPRRVSATRKPTPRDEEDFMRWAAEAMRTKDDAEQWAGERRIAQRWGRTMHASLPASMKRGRGQKRGR